MGIERILLKSFSASFILTILSPFMGKLRFPGTIWLQLLLIFFKYFIVFVGILCVLEYLEEKFKNWRKTSSRRKDLK